MTTLTMTQLPVLWHVIFNGNLVWLSISWHSFYTTSSYDIDHHNTAYLATHKSRRRRWVHVRAVTLGHWKRAANAATCNPRMSWYDWCWFALHGMYYIARLSSCCPSKEAGWHCCILSVSQAYALGFGQWMSEPAGFNAVHVLALSSIETTPRKLACIWWLMTSSTQIKSSIRTLRKGKERKTGKRLHLPRQFNEKLSVIPG